MSFLRSLRSKLPGLPSTPPTHEPARSTLLQLAFIIGIAILMHFQIADLRIGLFAAIVFALKLGLVVQGKASPNRLVMMVLTILSLTLIIAFYGGWNGQRAGISFLALLLSLKFLESRGLRDYFVVCLILYFLAASSFLFNSSIISIVVVLLYTVGITSVLFQLANPTPMGAVDSYRTGGVLVLKAAPLAILLFFFFPRIQADFGFFPSQDSSSFELNNSLVAGELAASAFNTELAFRAEFEGDVPSNDDRYWRAKVMTVERNFSWEVSEPNVADFQRAKALESQLNLSNGDYKYQILHERSTDRYLPYLDYVVGAERGKVMQDYSVYSPVPSAGVFSYKGSASLTPLAWTEDIDRESLTQTQSKPNARLQAQLIRWRNAAKTDTEKAELVYQFFLDNPFAYSLAPPVLSEFTPVDDFLFNTQTGYCEHYASAFTILMRWLDVPARVVVGYQGGRINSSGRFVELQYSDAHAWSEVWLDGRWVRVDPTAAVSPERIEFGMDALIELWDSGMLGSNGAGSALSDFLNPTGAKKWMRALQDTWSNVGYQWNKWITEYNFDTQKELLTKLGLEHKNSAYTLTLIMVTSAGLVMLFYFWQLVPRRVRRTDLQNIYLRFVNRFKRFDIQKHRSETPAEFGARAIREFPSLEEDILNITMAYQELRYGKETSDQQQRLDALQALIKRFKITKQSGS